MGEVIEMVGDRRRRSYTSASAVGAQIVAAALADYLEDYADRLDHRGFPFMAKIANGHAKDLRRMAANQ